MASAIMSHATRGCWTTSGHSGTITAFSHKLRWPGTTQFHLYLQASHSPSPLHKLQLEWRGSAPGRTSSASSPTCSVATPFASERSRAITKHLQLQLNSEAVELAKHAGHSERGVQVATNGASTGAGTVSWAGELPTTAGGVVIFNIAPDKAFSILITQDTRYPVPKPAAAHGVPARKDLVLHVNGDSAAFYIRESGQEHLLVKVVDDPKLPEPAGFAKEKGEKRSYWLSFDRTHLTVKYGKGYHMVETTLMAYDFYQGTTDPPEMEKIREQYATLFGTFNKLVSLLDYDKTIQITDFTPQGQPISQDISDAEGAVNFDQLPLTSNPPPLVKDSSEVTLFDLDNGNFTLSANLDPTCQVLYRNVAAGLVDLDWPPGVGKHKLSDAIRHSLTTEGCILKKALDAKGALGDEANEKYLRVTLGASSGQSPGIPYVLELWSSGNKSPIHNHGNAYAIIKVLHGGLTVKGFNKLKKTNGTRLAEGTAAPAPLRKLDISKGDVTWISPFWYQAHQLENCTDDYCATIQCYMYGEQDRLNWPYFDYLGGRDVIDEFYPDSDFDFASMREAVLKEYADEQLRIGESQSTLGCA